MAMSVYGTSLIKDIAALTPENRQRVLNILVAVIDKHGDTVLSLDSINQTLTYVRNNPK